VQLEEVVIFDIMFTVTVKFNFKTYKNEQQQQQEKVWTAS